MEQLEGLPTAKGLYEYRKADGGVPLWLPHNQGDIFDGVDLACLTGQAQIGCVMLFLHPCTMRGSKGALVERATVIEVKSLSTKKSLDTPEMWARRYSVIPLPDFSGMNADAYEANLFNMGTVPMASLTRGNRVASFSEVGRAHMLHRIIFHLTRKSVPTGVLVTATQRVQAEIQLQADWVASVWERFGELTETDVESVESEFQTMLSESWPTATADSPATVREVLYSDDESDHLDAFGLIQERCGTEWPGSCLASLRSPRIEAVGNTSSRDEGPQMPA